MPHVTSVLPSGGRVSKFRISAQAFAQSQRLPGRVTRRARAEAPAEHTRLRHAAEPCGRSRRGVARPEDGAPELMHPHRRGIIRHAFEAP